MTIGRREELRPRLAPENQRNGLVENGENAELSARLASLTGDEQRALAVLAAVGGASLAPDEIAELAEIHVVDPILAKLERLGMVRGDEEQRRALQPALVPTLRRAWNIVDTADRVLRHFIAIAEDGRLTLADLDAVLGIATWAAGAGRLTELVTLLRAVERAVLVTRRVEAWLEVVRRAREAAHHLGDREAEAWADEQLRVCERLRIGGVDETVPIRRTYRGSTGPRVPRLALAGGAMLALAGAGFALGFSAGGASDGEDGPTVALPGETLTLPGEAVTLPGETVTAAGETVTLPGETVTLPADTVTLPGETVTLPAETVTVFSPPPGPG